MATLVTGPHSTKLRFAPFLISRATSLGRSTTRRLTSEAKGLVPTQSWSDAKCNLWLKGPPIQELNVRPRTPMAQATVEQDPPSPFPKGLA